MCGSSQIDKFLQHEKERSSLFYLRKIDLTISVKNQILLNKHNIYIQIKLLPFFFPYQLLGLSN